MKVEQHGAGGPVQTAGIAPAGEAPAAARPSGTARATDQLELSAGVQAMQTAYEKAVAQPDIRADVVARMRELEEKGELGRDADRLADAMIDHWLTTP